MPSRAVFVYEPSFHCWVPNRPGEDVDDHEHDTSTPFDWGWICNADGCNFRTDIKPCPEHAPVEVPELRLTECHIEPRHWLWAHRNDDYGHGKDDITARNLLDKARKARGIGPTELTLFDTPDDERDSDGKGPWPGDPDYKAPGTDGDDEPTAAPKKATRRGARSAVEPA